MNPNEIKIPEVKLREVDKERPEYFDLLNSVKDMGIVQPIIVRKLGNIYELVDGLHRLTVALDLELEDVPVEVKELSDDESLNLQIQLNLQRLETRPSEYAKVLRYLAEQKGLSIRDLAVRVNKSAAWVKNVMSITKLPRDVQTLMDEGIITLGNGLAMLALPDNADDTTSWIPKSLIEKAKVMKTDDFKLVIQAESKRRRADRFKDRDEEDWEPKSKLRPLSEIKQEFEALRHMREDSYKAGLLFAMSLDPVTYNRRVEEYNEQLAEARKRELERRKTTKERRLEELMKEIEELKRIKE